jgi:hypothetical protein
MRSLLWTALAAGALAACVEAPQSATPQAMSQPAPGVSALSVIGTPFLVALKIPVCILTVAVAGPVAGLSVLADPSGPDGADTRRQLNDGIVENCGPPYVVAP